MWVFEGCIIFNVQTIQNVVALWPYGVRTCGIHRVVHDTGVSIDYELYRSPSLAAMNTTMVNCLALSLSLSLDIIYILQHVALVWVHYSV